MPALQPSFLNFFRRETWVPHQRTIGEEPNISRLITDYLSAIIRHLTHYSPIHESYTNDRNCHTNHCQCCESFVKHQPTHNLKLVVSNPTQVASGLAREHVFGISGGSIGSAGSDTWQLSSHRTGAVGGHAEVRF